MDLPFLSLHKEQFIGATCCFNPYSNGSSFFIFYIFHTEKKPYLVSILILMDLPFLFAVAIAKKRKKHKFQSLF